MAVLVPAVDLLNKSFDLFRAKNMRGWADLCAPNVVAEFPFAPEGSLSRIEGRDALYEYLRGYPEMIDIQSLTTMRVFGTDDPNVAIADWSISGRLLSNGEAYEMSYATFATFRGGVLVKYREYWNPMVFLTALGDDMF